MSDTLELSERTAREILNQLEEQFGSLHRLRAAYKLLCCAEALLELCEHGDTADKWQSLGDAAARSVEARPARHARRRHRVVHGGVRRWCSMVNQ